MLTYVTHTVVCAGFKKTNFTMYAMFAHDRLFRKKSSHGSMLAYFMLHLQVGIRTQTRTEIAILSTITGQTAPDLSLDV